MTTQHYLFDIQADPIRQFTERGIEQFRAYLTAAKAGATDPLPAALLFDDAYARTLDRHITVEPQSFATTLEMVRYLHPKIKALRLEGKLYDRGLWAWLTAYYFDQVCPPDKAGRRKVGEIVRYLPSAELDFRDTKRHLLGAAMRMYDTHGEKRMQLFLYTPPYERSDFLRLITESQELAANSNLLDSLHRLYWDEFTQRPVRGAKGSKKGTPGSVLRFFALMNQFNRTFDLFSMTGEQIVALLPKDEFGRWLE